MIYSAEHISDEVLFSGGSFQNLVKLASSTYATDFDAFYELIKNIEDQGASEIITQFDYKNNRAILWGDGEGADVPELIRIQKNAGKSRKDDSHHGIGLYSFLKSARRLVFISKCNGEYNIMTITPHPNGEHVYSDVGAPHTMSGKEKAEYHEYIYATRKYAGGTIYIWEGVGKGELTITSKFNMEEKFTKRAYVSFLRDKCNFSLKTTRFFLKDITKKKLEHITAKMGSGTSYRFSVPSNSCPYPKEKTKFIHLGREFQLSLECELWVSTINKKEVVITEEHKNALTIDTAYGVCQKINRHSSIFRSNPLGQYMEGEISFKVFPVDGGGVPSFYSGARSSLLLNNSFGDVLSNMINRLEIDKMRPILEEFSEHQRTKMDTKVNKRYEDLISTFFKTYDFDNVLISNTGPIAKQKRTCPSCKKNFDLLHTQPPLNSMKINAIFSQGDMYCCGVCGHLWEKEKRDPYTKHDRNPIYAPPTPKEGGERKRKHGLGYNIHCRPLARDDRRSMFESPSTVVINTSHPDYHRMKQSKSGYKDTIMTLRDMNLTFKEIIEHTQADNPDKHLELFQDMCSKFHLWYLTAGGELKKLRRKIKK